MHNSKKWFNSISKLKILLKTINLKNMATSRIFSVKKFRIISRNKKDKTSN